MAVRTVTTIKYSFKKPPIISEYEFISYKQILSVDPTYKLGPKLSFWKEFSWIIWLSLAAVPATIIGIIWEDLVIIPGLVVGTLFLGLLFSVDSIWSYQHLKNKVNHYYSNLKQMIIGSENYESFKTKVLQL